MPRTRKIHLAITGTHRGIVFTRSLCDNGGGFSKLVADFSLLTDEERGPHGQNVCLACLGRIPRWLAWASNGDTTLSTTPEN